ncbi:hypothetical protein [Leekyejoonella antrihumi]|uniref:Uncharacterized protein n=1 Tax=Leekyejoonella antrihumi TaxID=1660198 RepID=A0A563DZ42_9MICO|nr:hypothetical protein [Leekyejoonella antrihumi]TWP35223.1 hypothetical protein FGL98_14955 [Leekyejoonella antrihumi]
MNFADKAKEAAAQASQIVQQGVAQGQTHLDEVQNRQHTGVLMRRLGEAFYAEQREGGPHEPVVAALEALDQHWRAAGADGRA